MSFSDPLSRLTESPFRHDDDDDEEYGSHNKSITVAAPVQATMMPPREPLLSSPTALTAATTPVTDAATALAADQQPAPETASATTDTEAETKSNSSSSGPLSCNATLPPPSSLPAFLPTLYTLPFPRSVLSLLSSRSLSFALVAAPTQGGLEALAASLLALRSAAVAAAVRGAVTTDANPDRYARALTELGRLSGTMALTTPLQTAPTLAGAVAAAEAEAAAATAAAEAAAEAATAVLRANSGVSGESATATASSSAVTHMMALASAAVAATNSAVAANSNASTSPNSGSGAAPSSSSSSGSTTGAAAAVTNVATAVASATAALSSCSAGDGASAASGSVVAAAAAGKGGAAKGAASRPFVEDVDEHSLFYPQSNCLSASVACVSTSSTATAISSFNCLSTNPNASFAGASDVPSSSSSSSSSGSSSSSSSVGLGSINPLLLNYNNTSSTYINSSSASFSATPSSSSSSNATGNVCASASGSFYSVGDSSSGSSVLLQRRSIIHSNNNNSNNAGASLSANSIGDGSVSDRDGDLIGDASAAQPRNVSASAQGAYTGGVVDADSFSFSGTLNPPAFTSHNIHNNSNSATNTDSSQTHSQSQVMVLPPLPLPLPGTPRVSCRRRDVQGAGGATPTLAAGGVSDSGVSLSLAQALATLTGSTGGNAINNTANNSNNDSTRDENAAANGKTAESVRVGVADGAVDRRLDFEARPDFDHRLDLSLDDSYATTPNNSNNNNNNSDNADSAANTPNAAAADSDFTASQAPLQQQQQQHQQQQLRQPLALLRLPAAQYAQSLSALVTTLASAQADGRGVVVWDLPAWCVERVRCRRYRQQLRQWLLSESSAAAAGGSSPSSDPADSSASAGAVGGESEGIPLGLGKLSRLLTVGAAGGDSKSKTDATVVAAMAASAAAAAAAAEAAAGAGRRTLAALSVLTLLDGYLDGKATELAAGTEDAVLSAVKEQQQERLQRTLELQQQQRERDLEQEQDQQRQRQREMTPEQEEEYLEQQHEALVAARSKCFSEHQAKSKGLRKRVRLAMRRAMTLVSTKQSTYIAPSSTAMTSALTQQKPRGTYNGGHSKGVTYTTAVRGIDSPQEAAIVIAAAISALASDNDNNSNNNNNNSNANANASASPAGVSPILVGSDIVAAALMSAAESETAVTNTLYASVAAVEFDPLLNYMLRLESVRGDSTSTGHGDAQAQSLSLAQAQSLARSRAKRQSQLKGRSLEQCGSESESESESDSTDGEQDNNDESDNDDDDDDDRGSDSETTDFNSSDSDSDSNNKNDNNNIINNSENDSASDSETDPQSNRARPVSRRSKRHSSSSRRPGKPSGVSQRDVALLANWRLALSSVGVPLPATPAALLALLKSNSNARVSSTASASASAGAATAVVARALARSSGSALTAGNGGLTSSGGGGLPSDHIPGIFVSPSASLNYSAPSDADYDDGFDECESETEDSNDPSNSAVDAEIDSFMSELTNTAFGTAASTSRFAANQCERKSDSELSPRNNNNNNNGNLKSIKSSNAADDSIGSSSDSVTVLPPGFVPLSSTRAAAAPGSTVLNPFLTRALRSQALQSTLQQQHTVGALSARSDGVLTQQVTVGRSILPTLPLDVLPLLRLAQGFVDPYALDLTENCSDPALSTAYAKTLASLPQSKGSGTDSVDTVAAAFGDVSVQGTYIVPHSLLGLLPQPNCPKSCNDEDDDDTAAATAAAAAAAATAATGAGAGTGALPPFFTVNNNNNNNNSNSNSNGGSGGAKSASAQTMHSATVTALANTSVAHSVVAETAYNDAQTLPLFSLSNTKDGGDNPARPNLSSAPAARLDLDSARRAQALRLYASSLLKVAHVAEACTATGASAVPVLPKAVLALTNNNGNNSSNTAAGSSQEWASTEVRFHFHFLVHSSPQFYMQYLTHIPLCSFFCAFQDDVDMAIIADHLQTLTATNPLATATTLSHNSKTTTDGGIDDRSGSAAALAAAATAVTVPSHALTGSSVTIVTGLDRRPAQPHPSLSPLACENAARALALAVAASCRGALRGRVFAAAASFEAARLKYAAAREVYSAALKARKTAQKEHYNRMVSGGASNVHDAKTAGANAAAAAAAAAAPAASVNATGSVRVSGSVVVSVSDSESDGDDAGDAANGRVGCASPTFGDTDSFSHGHAHAPKRTNTNNINNNNNSNTDAHSSKSNLTSISISSNSDATGTAGDSGEKPFEPFVFELPPRPRKPRPAHYLLAALQDCPTARAALTAIASANTHAPGQSAYRAVHCSEAGAADADGDAIAGMAAAAAAAAVAAAIAAVTAGNPAASNTITGFGPALSSNGSSGCGNGSGCGVSDNGAYSGASHLYTPQFIVPLSQTAVECDELLYAVSNILTPTPATVTANTAAAAASASASASAKGGKAAASKGDMSLLESDGDSDDDNEEEGNAGSKSDRENNSTKNSSSSLVAVHNSSGNVSLLRPHASRPDSRLSRFALPYSPGDAGTTTLFLAPYTVSSSKNGSYIDGASSKSGGNVVWGLTPYIPAAYTNFPQIKYSIKSQSTSSNKSKTSTSRSHAKSKFNSKYPLSRSQLPLLNPVTTVALPAFAALTWLHASVLPATHKQARHIARTARTRAAHGHPQQQQQQMLQQQQQQQQGPSPIALLALAAVTRGTGAGARTASNSNISGSSSYGGILPPGWVALAAPAPAAAAAALSLGPSPSPNSSNGTDAGALAAAYARACARHAALKRAAAAGKARLRAAAAAATTAAGRARRRAARAHAHAQSLARTYKQLQAEQEQEQEQQQHGGDGGMQKQLELREFATLVAAATTAASAAFVAAAAATAAAASAAAAAAAPLPSLPQPPRPTAFYLSLTRRTLATAAAGLCNDGYASVFGPLALTSDPYQAMAAALLAKPGDSFSGLTAASGQQTAPGGLNSVSLAAGWRLVQEADALAAAYAAGGDDAAALRAITTITATPPHADASADVAAGANYAVAGGSGGVRGVMRGIDGGDPVGIDLDLARAYLSAGASPLQQSGGVSTSGAAAVNTNVSVGVGGACPPSAASLVLPLHLQQQYLHYASQPPSHALSLLQVLQTPSKSVHSSTAANSRSSQSSFTAADIAATGGSSSANSSNDFFGTALRLNCPPTPSTAARTLALLSSTASLATANNSNGNNGNNGNFPTPTASASGTAANSAIELSLPPMRLAPLFPRSRCPPVLLARAFIATPVRVAQRIGWTGALPVLRPHPLSAPVERAVVAALYAALAGPVPGSTATNSPVAHTHSGYGDGDGGEDASGGSGGIASLSMREELAQGMSDLFCGSPFVYYSLLSLHLAVPTADAAVVTAPTLVPSSSAAGNSSGNGNGSGSNSVVVTNNAASGAGAASSHGNTVVGAPGTVSVSSATTVACSAAPAATVSSLHYYQALHCAARGGLTSAPGGLTYGAAMAASLLWSALPMTRNIPTPSPFPTYNTSNSNGPNAKTNAHGVTVFGPGPHSGLFTPYDSSAVLSSVAEQLVVLAQTRLHGAATAAAATLGCPLGGGASASSGYRPRPGYEMRNSDRHLSKEVALLGAFGETVLWSPDADGANAGSTPGGDGGGDGASGSGGGNDQRPRLLRCPLVTAARLLSLGLGFEILDRPQPAAYSQLYASVLLRARRRSKIGDRTASAVAQGMDDSGAVLVACPPVLAQVIEYLKETGRW